MSETIIRPAAVPRKEKFSQVCVWPGTTGCFKDEGKPFIAFMKKNFNARIQPLEEIITGPDFKNGRKVSGSGGRTDVLFAVHDDDIKHFAIARMKVGIRWIEDVLDNESHHEEAGESLTSIYPNYVVEYRTW